MTFLPPWIRAARAADDAETLLGYLDPARVTKQKPNPLTKPGLETFTRQLARSLIEHAADAEDAAARRVRDLLDVNWARLSAKQRAAVIAEAEKTIAAIGPTIAGGIGDVLRARGSDVIAATRAAAVDTWKLSIPVQVSEQDTRFVEHAATAQQHYVTNQYGQRAAALSEDARSIVSAGIADGLDPATIGADLFAALGSRLGRTESYFTNVASIFTARARTASVVSSFEDAEIERYQLSAVMDEATCFAPWVRVLMGDGRSMRQIKNIREGDWVMSCKGAPREVKGTITAKTRTWGTLRLDGRAPLIDMVTQSHGFLTDLGWMRASSLGKGDRIALYKPAGVPGSATWLWGEERLWGMRRGRHDPRTIDVAPYPHALLDRIAVFAAVTRVSWRSRGANSQACVDAYDLEVDEDAGYIAEGLIVHNSHICRALDGRTFEVAAARKALDAVMEAPPEDVKGLLPFVSDGRDDNGETVMRIKRGEERVTVGKVVESAVGRKDEAGTFSGVMSESELVAHGVLVPPFHGHCRTLLLPVM